MGLTLRTIGLSMAIDSEPPSSAIVARLKDWWQWYIKKPIADLKSGGRFGLDHFSADNTSFYRFLFVVCAVLILIAMPLMSIGVGITWDEQIEHSYGKDVLNYFLSGGTDMRWADESIHLYNYQKFYGTNFNVFCAAVYKFLSPFGEYETKHFISAIVGFVGVLFAGLTAKRLGGWRAGFLALIFLFISQRWLGHSLNSPKDIPFGVGYLISVWAIIKLYLELPNFRKRTIAWVILGLAVVIGVRLGGILLICYLGMMMGINWLEQVKKKGFGASIKLLPRYALAGVSAIVISYALSIATWPYMLQDPIGNTIEAMSTLTGGNYVPTYELFDGVLGPMNQAPWYYIPKWVGISMPLLVIIGLVVSVLGFFWMRRIYDWRLLLFLFFVATFPWAYGAYNGTVFYNGWRHMLLLAPLVAILGALGWDFIFRISHKQRYVSIGAGIILSLMFLKTGAWMVRNYPNNYVYFNELVGGIKGAFGKYELDYYGNSMRQGVEWLVENRGVVDSTQFSQMDRIRDIDQMRIGMNCENTTGQYYLSKYTDPNELHERPNDEVAMTIWVRHYEKSKNYWDYALINPRTMSGTEMKGGGFPPPGTIHTIDIDNTPILAIVKRENGFMYNGYKSYKARDYATAIDSFSAATLYAPQIEETWRMLGMSYLNNGQAQQAIAPLEKAISLWPESYFALDAMARIHLNKGENEKALVRARLAYLHKTNVGSAYQYAGIAAERLGRYQEARDEYQKGIGYAGGRAGQGRMITLMGQTYFTELNQNPSLQDAQKRSLLQNGVNYLAQAINVNPSDQNALNLIINGLRQLGDTNNVAKYQEMLNKLLNL